MHNFNFCISYLDNSLFFSTSEVQVIQSIYFIIHCNFRCNEGKLSGEVKKTHRILVQLLFSTLLPCLTRKPFDGFNVITVMSGSTITVFLWVSNQMITLINLSLYVIAASNNLLVLYKKERQENVIYCTNFCVLNLIFLPWSHQPATHLTYCINFNSDNSKKYLQGLFKISLYKLLEPNNSFRFRKNSSTRKAGKSGKHGSAHSKQLPWFETTNSQ